MRILSYNIQAAIASTSYLSYALRLHRQVLPSPAKRQVLGDIARFISDFDVVCLQEIDFGGLRNGFHSQAQQLLVQTPFSHSVWQVNRVVGKLSRHGNLILSKSPMREVVNEPLPGKIKGRGMLAAEVETARGRLVVANVHLSLGAVDQFRQIRFVRQKLAAFENVCLMGDFNCAPDSEQLCLLTDHDYARLTSNSPTYPSWKPKQTLDHIFVKGSLKGACHVSQFAASDHLPVVLEVDD